MPSRMSWGSLWSLLAPLPATWRSLKLFHPVVIAGASLSHLPSTVPLGMSYLCSDLVPVANNLASRKSCAVELLRGQTSVVLKWRRVCQGHTATKWQCSQELEAAESSMCLQSQPGASSQHMRRCRCPSQDVSLVHQN